MISDLLEPFSVAERFSASIALGLLIVEFFCFVVKDHRSVVFKAIVNFSSRLFELLAKNFCHVFVALFYVRHGRHFKTWNSRHDVKAKCRRNVTLIKFGLCFGFVDFDCGVNFDWAFNPPFVVFEPQRVFPGRRKRSVNAIVLSAIFFVFEKKVLGLEGVEVKVANVLFVFFAAHLRSDQPRHAFHDAVVGVGFGFLKKESDDLFTSNCRNVKRKNDVVFLAENENRSVVVFLKNFKLSFGARCRKLDSIPVEFRGLLFQIF